MIRTAIKAYLISLTFLNRPEVLRRFVICNIQKCKSSIAILMKAYFQLMSDISNVEYFDYKLNLSIFIICRGVYCLPCCSVGKVLKDLRIYISDPLTCRVKMTPDVKFAQDHLYVSAGFQANLPVHIQNIGRSKPNLKRQSTVVSLVISKHNNIGSTR